MIRFGNPSATVRRLAAALEPHLAGMSESLLHVRMLGADDDPATVDSFAQEAGARLMVLSWIGAHPDARADVLRHLWTLEERCRAAGVPVLTLRLGPLIGPRSPLWLLLGDHEPAARLARKRIHPVLESDVIETLARAVRGTIPWEGWWELGGPEILSVGELAALARATHLAPGGEWEPEPEALAEQRLIEPEVWTAWSGIVPGSVLAEAARWVA